MYFRYGVSTVLVEMNSFGHNPARTTDAPCGLGALPRFERDAQKRQPAATVAIGRFRR